MGVFARPNLSDTFFKQNIDDILTLSGETNVIGVLKSKDVEIDASLLYATGGTTGGTGATSYVLTLVDNKVRFTPIRGGGGIINTNSFDSNRRTSRSGIPSITASGTTVQEFLETYFFPPIFPTSSLNIGTDPTARLFGDNTLGNLIWSITKNTNNITTIQLDTDGDSIYDYNVTPISGTSQTGLVPYTLTGTDYAPPINTLQKNRMYSLKGIANPGEITTSYLTISWKHKIFWFKSTVNYISGDDALIQAILNAGSVIGSELSITKVKTFLPITFSNEYFYFIIPDFFGVPSFIVNGLPNNAWGNSSINTLFTISYTNTKSYNQNFYVCKSDNKLSTTFNISCT